MLYVKRKNVTLVFMLIILVLLHDDIYNVGFEYTLREFTRHKQISPLEKLELPRQLYRGNLEITTWQALTVNVTDTLSSNLCG